MKNFDPDEKPIIEKGHEIIETEFDPNAVGVLEQDNTSTLSHNQFEEIVHKLDMGKYSISGVGEGVVLGKEIKEETDKKDDGWNVSKSGLYVGKKDSPNGGGGNKLVEVLLVGRGVEDFQVGDIVACALDTGIKTVDFLGNGDEVCLMRQENIFFKVERK